MLQFLYNLQDLVEKAIVTYKTAFALPLTTKELEYLKPGDRVSLIEKVRFREPIKCHGEVINRYYNGKISISLNSHKYEEVHIATAHYDMGWTVVRKRRLTVFPLRQED